MEERGGNCSARDSTASSLAAVLAANFLGLTFQVRTGIGIPLRDALVGAFAGGQDLLGGAARSAFSFVGAARDAGRVRADREALAERVARLEWELTIHRGLLERARGFTVLDKAVFAVDEPVPAEIIGAGASLLDRTVTVNRGARHGIARNAVVMAATGLVGRVVSVGPDRQPGGTADRVHRGRRRLSAPRAGVRGIVRGGGGTGGRRDAAAVRLCAGREDGGGGRAGDFERTRSGSSPRVWWWAA